MGQDTLVTHQIDDGQKLLARLGQEHFDVTAAAWIRLDDESRWQLYIASRAVDENRTEAFLALRSVVRDMGDLWVATDDIRLIGAAEPMAIDLVAQQPRHPTRIPARIRFARLGGRFIEEGFVYPPQPGSERTDAPASGGS